MFKEKWNNFWFEERSRQTLCLMRIFIGLTFLYKQIIFNNLLVKGIVVEFPQHSIKSQEDFYFDVFRNPIPGFEWLPYPTLAQYHMIEDLMFILTIFFVVGLFVRIVGPLIAITYLYFFMLSQFVYYHHIMNFAVVFLILGFSNCSDHYSLDSLIKKIKKVPRRKILPIRLFQVFISIIYFFSFIQKLKGGWLTGDIMIA
ncbi:MAG: HTTM domain-containing protein, partial [Candidatus Dadabacteria bacterium]|nr:HTTM domain-containing protein [Candidatus Dadabacteria bacterium]